MIPRTILKTAVFCLMLISSAHANTCINGNGRVRETLRSVDNYQKLHVKGIFEVDIRCGAPNRLIIRGDQNLFPHVDTQVREKVLYIDTLRPICTRSPLKVSISVPKLQVIRLGGTVDATVSNVNNKVLDVECEGAAQVNVSGKTHVLRVTLKGSSDLDAAGLAADRADVMLTGASSANITPIEDLDASVEGAASLSCHRSPRTMKSHISAAGSIACEPAKR